MIYSLFDRRYSFCTVFWVSSFYLSVNIVVVYQFTVTCIENLERQVSRTGKRFEDLWICESRCQVSDRLHAFAGFFLPLHSSATTVYARSTFYPSQQSSFCILHPACVLLSVCSLHFTLSQHFTPGPHSAVRTPQSSFYTGRFSNRDYFDSLKLPFMGKMFRS